LEEEIRRGEPEFPRWNRTWQTVFRKRGREFSVARGVLYCKKDGRARRGKTGEEVGGRELKGGEVGGVGKLSAAWGRTFGGA